MDETSVGTVSKSAEPGDFNLWSIAVPAFGPSLLFGIGEGAILPVIPLSARDMGSSLAGAALVVALIGIGSLISNIPASIVTAKFGERGNPVRTGEPHKVDEQCSDERSGKESNAAHPAER